MLSFRKIWRKPKPHIIDQPGLRILTLTDVGTSSRHSPRKCKQLLRLLMQPFTQLTSLDLSNWIPLDFNFLSHVEGTMQGLILYNVPRSNIEKGLNVICGMKKLRHLDVSQWNDSTPSHIGTFSNPSAILTRLLDSLPELKSLDLSGTNLPSQTTDASQEDSALLKCFYTKHDIKTLKERFNVTESFLYDRLVKDDRRSSRHSESDAWRQSTNVGRQSNNAQLDRRKRYLSWGDEDPSSSDSSGSKVHSFMSMSFCDSTFGVNNQLPPIVGRLLPTASSSIFLEPIRPPLDFLGLLQCKACEFRNLPARRVAGHHFAEGASNQVLTAVHNYQDKVDLLVKALQYLFQIFRSGVCEDVPTALDGILTATELHPRDNRVQISGSASLFYIVKNSLHHMGMKTKRRIIRSLLAGMENHCEETTMLRNACLTISHFDIPIDMLFAYDRVVAILLNVVRAEQPDQFVQRIGIFLLNSLACQVEGNHKLVVGLQGGIDTMLSIINHKLEREEPVCDEVMEIAWSTMWNVTDETSENCSRFLERDGMRLFVRCLEAFPDKPELLRNMLGLLGNVAEVKQLRPKLMNDAFLSIFSDLLDSKSDGIEVSYNAAGVLAHIAFDGADAWTLTQPENVRREFVLKRMVAAIESWELTTSRNINYRSFEPILRLVNGFDTPEVQHWAVWALANLTTVYSDKYCALIRFENGEMLLQNLIDDPRPYARVKELAARVLDNVKAVDEKKKRSRMERGGGGGGDEQVDGEEEEVVMETDEED